MSDSPQPDPAPGATVFDAEGGVIGTIRGAVGTGYVEIERNSPNWFVPVEVIEFRRGRQIISIRSVDVQTIDLETSGSSNLDQPLL
jgi:hypothetical protein